MVLYIFHYSTPNHQAPIHPTQHTPHHHSCFKISQVSTQLPHMIVLHQITLQSLQKQSPDSVFRVLAIQEVSHSYRVNSRPKRKAQSTSELPPRGAITLLRDPSPPGPLVPQPVAAMQPPTNGPTHPPQPDNQPYRFRAP